MTREAIEADRDRRWLTLMWVYALQIVGFKIEGYPAMAALKPVKAKR